MLRLMRVTGSSLSPEYQEGDFVVIATIPFFLNRIQVGDVVVFRHPEVGVMIKRVSGVIEDKKQYLVSGTQPYSVDSARFGPISPEALIGKVIWHISRPAR